MASKDVEAPPAKETTPLVKKDDGAEGDEEGGKYSASNEPPPLEDMKGVTTKEKVVAGAGFGCAGASIATVIFNPNPIVWISSIVGIGVGPYAAIQQNKLTQVEALRQTNKRMSEEVDQLKFENERLQGQVGSLEDSVKNLQNMQKTLETVQAAEGQSIDELEKQLEDTKLIYESMEQNLNGEILQNLINVILTVDGDGDMMLDDDEIDDLIHKFEGLNGVDLDDDKFRAIIIKHGRSLNAIMELVRNLLEDPTGDHDDIFKLKG